jgi:hypothetical protein
MKHPKPQFVAIALLPLLILLVSVANAQTVTLEYTWDAPTEGTPVEHYIIQHSVNGGVFSTVGTAQTNTFVLEATVGDTHRIRVAGVDDQSRQGPFSEPSDPYTPDLGPPGQPGKPILM